MNELPDEHILEKIKKILALTESPNENEAAVAAAKVKELLTQYNLDIADVEIADVKTASDIESSSFDAHYKWHSNLFAAVGRTHFCRVYKDTYTKRTVMVGTRINVQVASTLANWIAVQLDYMAFHKVQDIDVGKLAYRNNFLHGAVARISERLDEMHRRQQDNTSVTALVVRHEDRINDWLEEQGIRLQRGKAKKVGSYGYDAGRSAADKVDLAPGSNQVKTPSQERLEA